MTQPPEASAAKVAWKRVDVSGAGITIDHHPEWATLSGDRLVYQRFSDEGAVSVRWGDGAKDDDVLAHTGIEAGARRAVESDEPTSVDGLGARRVRLRVVSPEIHGHDLRASDRERIFVFVGFDVGATHVLVAYRARASELARFEPLLDHVLASVRKH